MYYAWDAPVLFDIKQCAQLASSAYVHNCPSVQRLQNIPQEQFADNGLRHAPLRSLRSTETAVFRHTFTLRSSAVMHLYNDSDSLSQCMRGRVTVPEPKYRVYVRCRKDVVAGELLSGSCRRSGGVSRKNSRRRLFSSCGHIFLISHTAHAL